MFNCCENKIKSSRTGPLGGGRKAVGPAQIRQLVDLIPADCEELYHLPLQPSSSSYPWPNRDAAKVTTSFVVLLRLVSSLFTQTRRGPTVPSSQPSFFRGTLALNLNSATKTILIKMPWSAGLNQRILNCQERYLILSGEFLVATARRRCYRHLVEATCQLLNLQSTGPVSSPNVFWPKHIALRLGNLVLTFYSFCHVPWWLLKSPWGAMTETTPHWRAEEIDNQSSWCAQSAPPLVSGEQS